MIPHKKYMQMAISLAKKAGLDVGLNPKVGCIIVKRGQIVGRGYHKQYGGPHAEVIALEQAQHKAKDSIMYVTLEPCSHWGKTPPCTEKIVEAGVREIIIGMKDPNSKVNGSEILKQRGLKVRMGIEEEACMKMNEGYVKYMKKRLPFVILKAGITLDGKIATSTGKSKYITGKEALKEVHKIRNELGVVMIGTNTLIKDNPKLDTRMIKGGVEPVKLVIDTNLKISLKANVLKKPETVVIACSERAPKAKMKKLEEMGVRLVKTKTKDKAVNLKEAMKGMLKLGYYNILLEGGSMINASMIKDKLVDKVKLFTSPKLLGDDAKGVIGPLGIKELDKAIELKNTEVKKFGKDVLIEGYI